MRRLTAFACITPLLLILAVDAGAQCTVVPRTTFVTSRAPVVVATPVAVVTPVLAATFINTVPSYSVGYNPGYQAGYGGGGYGNDDVGKAILEELKALRAETQAMRAALGGGGATKAFAAAPKGAGVLTNRCASCHDQAVAKVKGGDNVLFVSGVFQDDEKGINAGRVIDQISSGKMPRNGKLSGDEKFDILFYLAVKEGQPDTVPMPGAKK